MVVIVDHCDRAQLLKFSNLKWIYIGDNKRAGYTENVLKANNRIFIAKDIERMIDFVRDNFIDYIGEISSQQTNKVLWYSSRMASKSIQTSMFHQYIYLKIFKNFLKDKAEDLLIVSADKEFSYNVSRIFADKEIVFKKQIPSIKQLYRKYRGYAKVIRCCIFWFLSRFFKHRRTDQFDVFLHSWIDQRVFQKLPRYNDPYFRDLEDVLRRKGYSIGRIAPLRVSLKNIFKLNSYFNNIVYPLSYVSLGEFFKSVFSKFVVTIDKRKLTALKDIEILNTLLENEICKENNTKLFLEDVLLFYGYRNMRCKIKGNTTLIYPFENQPWEKMFNLAFTGFRKIAYQHSAIFYNWLDYRTSFYEKGMPLPKIILTAGKKWSSFLKEYYSNATIEEAGALRFSYLFNNELRPDANSRVKSIVVALPLMTAISLALQKQLLKFLKKSDLKEYSIKINYHTYLPRYGRLEALFANFKNCRFVKESARELFKDCFLLITSNSTVVFESVFLGIKTLYFIPEQPTLSHEHYIKDHLFIAYEDNFSEKLNEALESSLYPSVNIKDYFSSPNYDIFLKYLGGNYENGFSNYTNIQAGSCNS